MIGLSVRIGRRVNPGLALDVAFRLGPERGILFGPSGSGKTTLLRLIAGLDRPDSGFVGLDDVVLFDSSAKIARPLRSRRIGVIYQDDLLFPHLSVEANVRFGLHRWPRALAEARFGEVAALCGVEALFGRRPATLSGGERQRVGLARALAPRPRLLLCDEPFSALDLDARLSLIARLRDVQAAESIPLLYVTHAADEAVALGTRLFLLAGGRIVAEGAPLEVLAGAARSASSVAWMSTWNIFPVSVEGHDPARGESRLRLDEGPALVVPLLDRPIGSRASVRVRSDDVVLARGELAALSARNVLTGTVARVVRHGSEAEVEVRVGGSAWIVGVVASSVEDMGLIGGAEVRMIVKARSCHVLPADRT